MKRNICLSLALAVLTLFATAAQAENTRFERSHQINRAHLKFDVAESASKFVFDEAPVFDNGLPAYGNAFITQGYIYPYGTLTGGAAGNGILPDGSPEFPDKVIGEWVCRGYFIGNGVNTETGPWVITTQHYDFYDEPGFDPNREKKSGDTNLITDGYELSDVGVQGKRAVTGGTGIFKRARGEAVQTLLGFNALEGVNLRFEIRPR